MSLYADPQLMHSSESHDNQANRQASVVQYQGEVDQMAFLEILANINKIEDFC